MLVGAGEKNRDDRRIGVHLERGLEIHGTGGSAGPIHDDLVFDAGENGNLEAGHAVRSGEGVGRGDARQRIDRSAGVHAQKRIEREGRSGELQDAVGLRSEAPPNGMAADVAGGIGLAGFFGGEEVFDGGVRRGGRDRYPVREIIVRGEISRGFGNDADIVDIEEGEIAEIHHAGVKHELDRLVGCA
jgi:hypothetical protein